MVKVVCGKSRIGEASYRAEGKGQIVVGEIELGEASWTRYSSPSGPVHVQVDGPLNAYMRQQ